MRRILPIVAALVLASCGPGQRPWGDEDSTIIRAYHLGNSGDAIDLQADALGSPRLVLKFDQDPAGATITSDTDQGATAYTLTKAGQPERVNDGTWTAGLSGAQGYAHRIDGTDDYWSVADGSGGSDFDFSGDFTILLCWTPRVGWAAGDYLVAKSDAANQRSWAIYHGTNTILLGVSDDGTGVAGHWSTLTKTAAWANNRMSCAVVTYDYVADGSSLAAIYVDELAAVTSATFDGPVFNSTSGLTIGAATGGTLTTAADGHYLVIWRGVAASEATARQFMRQWRTGDGTGITCTAATMGAQQIAPLSDGSNGTVAEPAMVEPPANACLVESPIAGEGGYCSDPAVSNLVQRRSFTTWAAGSPTGWTEVNTAGSGAADWTEDLTTSMHGLQSARATLTAADSETTLTGACLTVTGATAYWAEIYAAEISGTGLFDLNIIEDDSADCGSPTTTTAVVNDAAPASTTWAYYGGTITTQAGTIRVQFQISLPAAAAQTLVFDAATLRLGTYHLFGFCPGDTDATATCSTVIPSYPDPMSANGSNQIELRGMTPFAGTDLAGSAILYSSGALTGADTAYLAIGSATDEPTFFVYDHAAAARSVSPNVLNWAALTGYTVKAYFDGMGGMGVWWNAAWSTTTAGAGTGIRAAAQATGYLSRSNAGFGACVREVIFKRRISR